MHRRQSSSSSSLLKIKLKSPQQISAQSTSMAIRLFLIAALCIFSVSADVFVSIDCGSSDSDTDVDENLITWMGDDDYMRNGEAHVVQSSSSESLVMDTLRAFTNRSKNCYTVEARKGERVLIRASFRYGNYDNKSSPPTFDLQFDGNRWATVKTLAEGTVYYEVVYVLKRDYVSVCVAQTEPDQIPFISALEVRSLLPTMYGNLDPNYPLYLITRVAYGAKSTIRYSDDPYDRIWVAAAGGNGLTAVISDALEVDSGTADAPPTAVLMNAVSAVNSNTAIKLPLGIPSGATPIYVNMYFSEVVELDSTQKRSFHIVMNNQAVLGQPVTPPYGNCTELNASNLTVSTDTTIDLVPAPDSTLPPLINAMEVFTIGGLLTNGTHPNDVDGLASLRNSFAELEDWSGDPCLPSPYSWNWINCTTDPTPRVTALHLGSFGLSGALPDFSGMDALETIDFHNNSLEGPIPEFLAVLPNLKQLNLASNQLSGAIPDSLSANKGLNFVVTDNPDLCTPGKPCKSPSTTIPMISSSLEMVAASSSNEKATKLGLILGSTISTFLAMWGIVEL